MFGSVRKLRFAGSWYSSNATLLGDQLDQFADLARVRIQNNNAPPLLDGHDNVLAIVAPHAGYMYSGATAAVSYQAVANRGYKRVFLLGPSHSVSFKGAALSDNKHFATVFGDLPVDRTLVEELKQSILFQVRNDIHADEHSLELQLAFIRRCLGKVKIVPVLLGRIDEDEAQFIGSKLLQYLEKEDLVVVSSDFTHLGPRYGYNPFGSAEAERLTDLDMQALSHLRAGGSSDLLEFYRRTEDTICGIYALTVLLSMLPPGSEPTLLEYLTSRQVVLSQSVSEPARQPQADELENSVSYMSIVYTHTGDWHDVKLAKNASELDQMQAAADFTLSLDEQNTLLELARKTLANFVLHGWSAVETARAELTSVVLTEKLLTPHGVFVTLYQGSEKQLRGCIGTIVAVQPLYLAVMENVVSSASRDPRFAPVAASELGTLSIELNVLTAPQPVSAAEQIRLGTDGILFYNGQNQSVFLPSVATEQGWNLEQALSQLALKAGLDKNAWKRNSRFEVFQSLVIH